MSRTTRFIPAVAAAAVFAPAAGASTMPPVFVHSAGANGAAYVNALTGNRALTAHRSSRSILITDNSATQNHKSSTESRLGGGGTYKPLRSLQYRGRK